MKLEMSAYDLDVRLELEDNDAEDQLEILTTVKTLIETLYRFEKVNVSIVQKSNATTSINHDMNHDVIEEHHVE